MKTITSYKDSALASLSGKWDKGIIVCLIYIVVSGVPAALSERFGWIWSFAMLPLAWGVIIFFLSIARNEEDLSYGSLFDGYKDFTRIFLTLVLYVVYVVLWTLLLVIPGFIKSYSYSMTYYILKDDPEIKYNEAIEKSMEMMKGHKMQLFLLDLSFIGWLILAILSFGIGLLWLLPYMYTTRAHFYEDLKAEFGE